MLFNNIPRARQLIDYENLQDGKIHPTDIDGVIEYHNKCYVFIEYKHKSAPFEIGQRLAYERLVADVAPKPAIAIVAEHSVDNPEDIVDGGEAIVRLIYTNKSKKWHNVKKKNIKVKEMVKKFIEVYGGQNEKCTNIKV